MSHEELIRLIREQDRLVLSARDKRDEARANLDVFMRVPTNTTDASIEASEEHAAWAEAKQRWVLALISFNREIANA